MTAENNTDLKPRFPDLKKTEVSYERGLEVLKIRRDFWIETRPYQEEATVELPANLPVTVVGIGDVHLGSLYSNLDIFNRDVALIERTEGMGAVFLSNLVDVPLPSQYPDSMLVNPLTPHEQAKVMNSRIRQLYEQGKILGMVRSPCHEGWTEKRAGLDIQQILFDGTEVPMLENGGVLKLSFPNGRSYKLALYHQFGKGYGSEQNKNYASWYQLRTIKRGNVDAIMIAHSHVGAVEYSYYGQHPNRKIVALVRTGSFKGNVSGEINSPNDIWIRDQSGKDGEPGGESVTFFPDKEEMRVHLSPVMASKYQNEHILYQSIVATGELEEVQKLLDEYRSGLNLIKSAKNPRFEWKKC